MFLLDTNVVSELHKAKAGRADPGVTAWVANVSPALIFMSIVSLHELEHEVLLAERRDPTQGAVLRRWLDTAVVPGGLRGSLPSGRRRHRPARSVAPRARPCTLQNTLIAATAIHHDMPVVTRDASDFEHFPGVDIINPWT